MSSTSSVSTCSLCLRRPALSGEFQSICVLQVLLPLSCIVSQLRGEYYQNVGTQESVHVNVAMEVFEGSKCCAQVNF